MAKSAFELKEGEKILCTDQTVRLKGGFHNVFGQIYLTNQRLLFVRNHFILGALFGLLGGLLAHWTQKSSFEVPLKEVTGIELSSFGFNKRVTLFHTLRGDEKFNMKRPYEEWEAVVKSLINK